MDGITGHVDGIRKFFMAFAYGKACLEQYVGEKIKF